jgi:hypothetical protein
VQSASGPVAAVFCENWIVYHYFSYFHMRHEMSVIELYDDSSARGLSLPDAIMSNTSTEISSTDPVAIKTLRFCRQRCVTKALCGRCFIIRKEGRAPCSCASCRKDIDKAERLAASHSGRRSSSITVLSSWA